MNPAERGDEPYDAAEGTPFSGHYTGFQPCSDPWHDQMTCADCSKRLRYSGRGRPPIRCAKCQTVHRREYLAAKQREHRAK